MQDSCRCGCVPRLPGAGSSPFGGSRAFLPACWSKYVGEGVLAVLVGLLTSERRGLAPTPTLPRRRGRELKVVGFWLPPPPAGEGRGGGQPAATYPHRPPIPPKHEAVTPSGEEKKPLPLPGGAGFPMGKTWCSRALPAISAAGSARSAAAGWPGPASRCRPAAGSACATVPRFPWRSRCRGCGCARPTGSPNRCSGSPPPR